MRVVAVAVVLAASIVAPASAAPSHHAPAPPRPAPAPTAPAAALTGTPPCPHQPGFACSTLRLPLDHQHPDTRSLDLAEASEDNAAAQHLLLFLTGGPGPPRA